MRSRTLSRGTAVDYGYIGSRTDTTQQSGQTPDKEVEIKNITVYVSGYTETDTTGMLSPPTVCLSVWPLTQTVMFLISSSSSGPVEAGSCSNCTVRRRTACLSYSSVHRESRHCGVASGHLHCR
jgi:hypothetical protein